ncbi:MAG: TRAP transporter small permease [Polyangiaceae bacterium]|nr:TRAP transporter small permease [Polyangiaceae bacterium]
MESNPSPNPKSAWGAPLARFDKWWTNVEAKLCAAVLLLEVVALCFWIILKGLSVELGHGGAGSTDKSGLVLRSLLGVVALGYAAHRVTAPKSLQPTEAEETKHRYGVIAGIVLGAISGRLWANSGGVYFANWLNWLQSASTLTLVGGLRGVATRLTLWLALLGASLATAQGKHINIDVVMRSLSPKMRVPAAVLGWVMAAIMCVAAALGFADHIAVSEFKAPSAGSFGEKTSLVLHEVSNDMFLLRKQITLDFKTFPKALMGNKYNEYLHANEWNAWVAEGGWGDHYKAEDIAQLRMPEEDTAQTHLPVISVPGTAESIPGLLVREINFIFVFGLLVIALRFLLRSLLAISGYVSVDPDSAHEDASADEKESGAETAKEGA